MQRAKPTIIMPTLYSGKSGRKTQASENIRKGPITQFKNSETLNIFHALATLPSSSYLTFASGGYIIHISPIAIVRRISGGGAVYHDLGNLNYTVIANIGKNGLPMDTLKTYKFISECLIEGLKHLIIQLNFLPPNTILLNEKKVGGMAQHLLYNVTLIHGTILVNANLELMKKLIKIKIPVINLSETKNISLNEVKENLLKGFKIKLQTAFINSFFTQNELKLAKKLLKIKYSKKWWNLQN